MESKAEAIVSVAFRGIDIEIYKRFPVSRALAIENSVEDALIDEAIWSSVDTLLREKYT